jgi:hypothetical protein
MEEHARLKLDIKELKENTHSISLRSQQEKEDVVEE